MINLMLSLAIIATLLGPLIYILFKGKPSLREAIDAFILIVTAGIIIFQVLPDTYQAIGFLSVVLVILGMGLPAAIEFLFRKAAKKTHILTLFLGVLGLLVHGVVDGSALTMSKYEVGSLLPLAIILHRTPISMSLWWLIKPQFGKVYAISVIAILIAGTLLGFYFSSSLLIQLHNHEFMIFEAIVSGTLLHVLYHQPGHQHSAGDRQHSHKQKWNKHMYMGASLALLVLLVLMNIENIH